MVFDIFRRGDPGIDSILRQVIEMLNDARHSFDLATDALLSGVEPAAVANDIRETDHRINQAEQALRSALVVHVSVKGGGDIGTVLGYILLIKKIERIGDQAKNILDLAEEGVSFAGASDLAELIALRRSVSDLFGRVGHLLAAPVTSEADDSWADIDVLRQACEKKVREYLHSDRPGTEVVPRAIFYRYLKRIVANLGGVTDATEPLTKQDYRNDGQTDIADD
ncbi:MAG: PhoU domain-containing protein [Acidimicrobiales bacterium]